MTREIVDSDYQIVPMTPDVIDRHLSSIVLLVHSVLGSSVWNREVLVEEIERKWQLSFCAVHGESIVGILIAYCVPFMNPLLLKEPCVFLRRLVVATHCRNLGISRKLLLELRRSLLIYQEHLPERICWQTHAKSSANKFFKHIGFLPVGSVSIGNLTDNLYSTDISSFCSIIGDGDALEA